MPSGKIHLRIEALGLIAWLAVGVYLCISGHIEAMWLVFFAIAYLASMLLLSPDLDLADSHAARRWGPFRFLWWPYAAIFKHRQISHHLLFGPLTRILYAAALVLLAWAGLAALTRRSFHVAYPSPALAISLLIGLYLPNVTHILADRLSSLRRR